MNIATITRFKKGELNKIWAGHGFSVISNFVFIAQHFDAGIIAIAAENELDRIVSVCDGLLVPGSTTNIDPTYFGGEAFDPPNYYDEYALDAKIIDAFVKAGKPIFGMCGGMQDLNVFFGGTLKLVPDKENHWSYQEPAPFDRYGNQVKYRRHPITVEENSFVADVHGAGRTMVNTYHSWAVDRVAPGFRAVATSDDGIIEAIECKEKNIFATQWHPELAYRMDDPVEMKFFENFFEVCRKIAEK